MDEFIERNALVNNLELLARHEDRFTQSVILGVVGTIRAIKAADVAPVIHARWVEGKCSNCGVDIPTDDAHDAIFESECRFCYYCGAKMDGGDKRCG